MTLYEEALMLLDEAKRRVAEQSITDDAIVEYIEEAIKRIQADHEALVAEHADMERHLVTSTTAAEQARIRSAHHDRFVRWVGGDYV